MEESPIAKSLKLLSAHPQRSTGLFYGTLLLIFCILIGLGSCPFIQKTLMRKFHFMPRPFAQWAALQFLPSMYNFKNDFLESPTPLPLDTRMEAGEDVKYFTVNHYPLRMLYFYDSRRRLIFSKPLYAYARTTFRQRQIVTSYAMVSSFQQIHIFFLNSYERFSGR